MCFFYLRNKDIFRFRYVTLIICGLIFSNNNTYIAPISILLFSSALKNKNIKKIKIKYNNIIIIIIIIIIMIIIIIISA